MSEILLNVKNLKKYFKTNAGMLHAVDDVSFSIEQGHTMGVVGESGCGKSTLGRTLLQLYEPTSGEIDFKGKNIANLSKKEFRQVRPKLQMIFQDPYSSLNGRMTVQQLIAEPLIVNKVCKNKKEIQERVSEIMDTVGLSERLAMAYPHELDGGRRQRIGVARALVLNPEFVVCDEPVSALDVSIQAQVLNLLQQLQKDFNLTYLFISHDLSVVEMISDRIGVMYLGTIVETAPKKELYANPRHPYTRALLSAVPIPDPEVKKERITLKGDLPSPSNPPSGCLFHTRCPHCTEKCKTQVPTPVEIAPGHIVKCHYPKLTE